MVELDVTSWVGRRAAYYTPRSVTISGEFKAAASLTDVLFYGWLNLQFSWGIPLGVVERFDMNIRWTCLASG